MILSIKGIDAKFAVDEIIHSLDSVEIVSADLCAYIESMVAPPVAPPAAPFDIKYEATDKLGEYTIDQFKATGWSEQQLIDGGYLKAVATPPAPAAEPTTPPAPAAEPTTPPAPAAEPKADKSKYIMAPKASGATEEQFIEQGWSRKDLIAEGYLILNPATAPKPNTSGWPQQNEENEWLDVEGTVFDEVKHAMTKSGVPGVTAKGVFKKRRGYKPEDPSVAPVQKEPAVAPPPTSTEAPAAPSAPSAPTAPSAPSAGDEPLDEELDSLIKNWE